MWAIIFASPPRDDKDLSKGIVPVMNEVHQIFLVALHGIGGIVLPLEFALANGMWEPHPLPLARQVVSFQVVVSPSVWAPPREEIREQNLPPVRSGLVVWASDGPRFKLLSLGHVCYCTITLKTLNQIVLKPVSWQSWNLNLCLSDAKAIAVLTVPIVPATMFWGHRDCPMVRP